MLQAFDERGRATALKKSPHFSDFFQDMKTASVLEREAIQRSWPERQSDTENLKTRNKSQSFLKNFCWFMSMIFIYFDLILRCLSVSGLQTTLCTLASLIHADSLIYV